jgi:glycosyltransferase involved in cell wall biosynthesis
MRLINHNNRPKIAFVFYNMGIGGIQRKIYDLVCSLQKEKIYDIDVIVEVEADTSFLDLLRKKPGVRILYKQPLVLRLPFFNFTRQVRFSTYLFFLLLSAEYQTVYTFLPRLCYGLSVIRKLLFWKKYKLICSQDVFFSDEVMRDKWPWWMIASYGLVCSWCDRYIVPSKAAGKSLTEQFLVLKKKMKVIYNWSVFPRTKNVQKDFDFCFLSRLDKEKNLEALLEFIDLCEALPRKCSFLIVGEGKKKLWLLDQLKAKNCEVHYVGKSLDSFRHLSRSKVLLSFSSSEGMPMTFLEAMSAECVVIAHSYFGIKEVVPNNSIGLVCRSVSEMFGESSNIIADEQLRKKIAGNAANWQSKSFGSQNLDLYKRFIF